MMKREVKTRGMTFIRLAKKVDNYILVFLDWQHNNEGHVFLQGRLSPRVVICYGESVYLSKQNN